MQLRHKTSLLYQRHQPNIHFCTKDINQTFAFFCTKDRQTFAFIQKTSGNQSLFYQVYQRNIHFCTQNLPSIQLYTHNITQTFTFVHNTSAKHFLFVTKTSAKHSLLYQRHPQIFTQLRHLAHIHVYSFTFILINTPSAQNKLILFP